MLLPRDENRPGDFQVGLRPAKKRKIGEREKQPIVVRPLRNEGYLRAKVHGEEKTKRVGGSGAFQNAWWSEENLAAHETGVLCSGRSRKNKRKCRKGGIRKWEGGGVGKTLSSPGPAVDQLMLKGKASKSTFL